MSLVTESAAILGRGGFDVLRKIAVFSAAVARLSWVHSIKILEESGDQIDRIFAAGGDMSSVSAIYGLASRMADDDGDLAMALVAKSPVFIERLTAQGLRDRLPGLYSRADQAVPFDAGMTYTFLDTAPALMERLGPTDVEPVWLCAFAMAQDHQETAVVLLMKSPEIVDHLLVLSHAPASGKSL